MGNIGRYVCVALPFCLTLASLIALLVATLGGVSDKSLYMFQVNMTNFQISPQNVITLVQAGVHTRDVEKRVDVAFHDPKLLPGAAAAADGSNRASSTGNNAATAGDILATNKTAAELGFYDVYNVGLWGYCFSAANGTSGCIPTSFNWAEKELALAKQNLETLIDQSGQQIDIPKAATDAMNTFSAVARWTEIAFIIALVALGVELVFGFFANCTRVLSCVTFLVSFVATVAVCAAAALSTALSAIVVGTVEGTAKVYGARGSMNTRFLATVWVAAAFAIAAGFFWLFTICCCAPDHNARRAGGRKRHLDDASEKMMPTGAYQPIQENYGHHHNSYQPQFVQQQHQPQYGYASNIAPAPRRDLAYEPYMRTA